VPPKTPEVKAIELTLEERKKKEEDELNMVAAKVIEHDIAPVVSVPSVVAPSTTTLPVVVTSTVTSVITKTLPSSTMSSFQRKPMVFVPASKSTNGVAETVTLAAAVRNTIKIVTTAPASTTVASPVTVQVNNTPPAIMTTSQSIVRPTHSKVIFQNAVGGGQKMITQIPQPQQFVSLSPQGMPKGASQQQQIRPGGQYVMQPPTIIIISSNSFRTSIKIWIFSAQNQ
jgi:hypothetical protein